MQPIGRKYPSVDIIKLYAQKDALVWNAYLTKCLRDKNINSLVAMLYGVQAGMKDVADSGMQSERLANFFIRIERSIEKTIQKIYRGDTMVSHAEKKDADNELEKKLHTVRF